MTEKSYESWVEIIRCTMAEFISRPNDATEAALKQVIAQYRAVVESGEVRLRHPRAA